MKERLTEQLVVKIHPSIRERLEREADRDGYNVSTLVRIALRRELRAREQPRETVAA